MKTALCVLLSVVQLVAQAPPAGAARTRTTQEIWHPQLEQFTPAGEIGIELGSPLSASGYRKLRGALPWTRASARTDYYFDAYDGHEFLLRTGVMPLKVRVKVRNGKSQWQVSRFVDKDQVVVGPLHIKVHTTESWQSRLAGRRAAELLAAGDAFAALLGEGGAPLRAAGERAAAAWEDLRARKAPAGTMVIESLLAEHPYRLYPRKVTTGKTRLTAKLPGVTPAVTLLLGVEPEVDADGNPVLAYELEAEPDAPITPAEARAIASAIGALLIRAGLTAADQQEVATFSNDYTLRQLAR